MTERRFRQICARAVKQLRKHAPKDTGNLAYNAIKYEFIGNTCKIYVDEAIAPYMPYTNEPWVSPRWHGKKNPNEKWFDDAVAFLVEYITKAANAQRRTRKK